MSKFLSIFSSKVKNKEKIRNLDNIYLWIITICAIYLNIYLVLHFDLRPNRFVHSIPILDNIHYGRYIFKRAFLVLIAICFLIYWLRPLRSFVKQIKRHILPITVILVCLLLAHFLSFGMWFGAGDSRAFPEIMEGLQYIENPYYPLMPYYLAMNFFGHNYVAYLSFGLFAYLLSGVSIFWLLNRLQTNKTISLLSSLYFVTTPNYFQAFYNMTEFIGDGFSLLLFIISMHLLVRRFYAGAVIFAAAAFELGISRTNFIFAPLLMTGLLFTLDLKRINWHQIVAFVAFPILFIISKWTVDYTAYNGFDNPLIHHTVREYILMFFTMIFAMSIPHEFINIFLSIFKLLLGDSLYAAPLIGVLILIFLMGIFTFLYKKNILSAKILLLGIVILTGAAVAPTIFSLQRLMQEIGKLTSQFSDIFPSSYTIYGIFPSFGVSVVIAGITLSFKSKRIRNVILYILLPVVLIANSVSSLHAEALAIKYYANPQKKINEQLKNLLPADGKQKIVFVPTPDLNNRNIYGGIIGYKSFFLPADRVTQVYDLSSFMQAVKTSSVSASQIYFFVHSINTDKIYDFSKDLMAIPREKLEDNFGALFEKAENFQ